MNKYELMFIVSASTTDEEKEAVIEKVKSILTSKGAVVEGVEKIGMKKFAYKINFQNEGYYVLVNLQANAEIINTATLQLNITDKVVRHIFVRK